MNVFREWYYYLGPAGLITFINVGLGWLSVWNLVNGNPQWGISFAIVAFFGDMIDGFVARKTGTDSAFGRQLDGMADFFNYVVTSVLIVMFYVLPGFWLASGVVWLMLITGMSRLVRFNVDGYKLSQGVRYYEGVTVCHLLLTVILLFVARRLVVFENDLLLYSVLLILVSLGQISRVPVRKTGTYLFWIVLALGLLVLVNYV